MEQFFVKVEEVGAYKESAWTRPCSCLDSTLTTRELVLLRSGFFVWPGGGVVVQLAG